ncbi:MAG: type II toxin-antitoxin system HicB family antitoxin [Chloroflexota bacterium]
MRRYSVLLIPDAENAGYSVKVPALPGLNTEGDTLDEALANARDAIHLYLDQLESEGAPIPEEIRPLELTSVEVYRE